MSCDAGADGVVGAGDALGDVGLTGLPPHAHVKTATVTTTTRRFIGFLHAAGPRERGIANHGALLVRTEAQSQIMSSREAGLRKEFESDYTLRVGLKQGAACGYSSGIPRLPARNYRRQPIADQAELG